MRRAAPTQRPRLPSSAAPQVECPSRLVRVCGAERQAWARRVRRGATARHVQWRRMFVGQSGSRVVVVHLTVGMLVMLGELEIPRPWLRRARA
jgi:hypothetical protein